MSSLSLITISLSPPFPETGAMTAIVRLTGRDKYIIDRAAAEVGVTKAVLMRILLVKGSERILQELGIKTEYEVDSPALWGET